MQFRLAPISALLLTVALIASCTSLTPPSTCDVLIQGGLVIDGSGAAPQRGDVMICGDTISFVGLVEEVNARQTIDAEGKVVTPGFLDPHAHGDPRRTPGFENFLAMGVTTICLGQDGVSPGNKDLASWRRIIAKGRFAANIAPLVGHGTLRRLAGIDMATEPTPSQLRTMVGLVETAMVDGAFGLSMGIEYEPGRFATAAELALITAPVGRHGGVVMSHIRSEDDDRIEAALRELFDACRAGSCRAHVAHLKIVYGREPGRADTILGLLDEYRHRGLQVSADVYPYDASYTGIGIVFPHWARPPNDYAEVVATRRTELASFLRRRVEQRSGPGAILFGNGTWRGKTLTEAATAAAKSFTDLLIDDLGPRGASAAHSVINRQVMERLLLADGVVVSSDGSPTMRHPRGHGAFAKVLREFVNERRRLGLATAIHKMTGMTAKLLGVHDRGLLRAGMKADVLVFDPAVIADRATYAQPFLRAVGFDTVLINGVLVRNTGAFTDARPGQLLRH